MGQSYLVPAAETRVQTRVSNSVFIATAARADTVEAARAFIQRIREEHAKATHNVYAFVIGHGASVIEGCHDDGEPSGTAGRPVLAVLRGSGLGDAVIVVTRYFGGTKLGAGGLVRAYGDAARMVLDALPRARKVELRQMHLTCPYAHYAAVRRLIEQFNGQVLDEQFEAAVHLRVSLAADDAVPFSHAVAEWSGHQVTICDA